ncbi:MAG: DUF1737 domain-containing protein [Pyrinomonadaceae bacterium]
MDYKIVTADGEKELETKVNELLVKGWKLQGGVSLSITYDASWGERAPLEERFAQALFKENVSDGD